MLTASAAVSAPAASADREFRRAFDESDYRAINEAGARYRNCMATAAQEQLPRHDDVRRALGAAVEHCQSVISELEQALDANALDPGLAQGTVRRIKSQAIQALLPGLLSARAAQDTPR